MTPTPPPSPVGQPNGPLARWLRHPGTTQRHWWHQLTGLYARQEHHVALLLAAIAVVAVTATMGRQIARRAGARHGRWVEIRPPAQPPADGGLALWRQLAPLLSARRSWSGPRPPVAFECLVRAGSAQLGLWVSRTISPTAVARAVQTAWPGATATPTVPPTLLPARRDRQQRSSGGQVRLAAAEWFPVGATPHGASGAGTPTADPLRGLLEALIDVPGSGTGVLQVLARPATGGRLRRARRAALAARRTTPHRVLQLPGLGATQAGRDRTSGPADPFALADVREISRKLADTPHFHVAVRVAVAGTRGRGGRAARRGWLRQISAALGLYTGRNHLILSPLHRPATTLDGRRLGRGFLLSVGELAILAHLPSEPARHGLAVAAARSIAPPAELTDA